MSKIIYNDQGVPIAYEPDAWIMFDKVELPRIPPKKYGSMSRERLLLLKLRREMINERLRSLRRKARSEKSAIKMKEYTAEMKTLIKEKNRIKHKIFYANKRLGQQQTEEQ